MSFCGGGFAASAGEADTGVLGPPAAGLAAPVLPESQPASVMAAQTNSTAPGCRHRLKGLEIRFINEVIPSGPKNARLSTAVATGMHLDDRRHST